MDKSTEISNNVHTKLEDTSKNTKLKKVLILYSTPDNFSSDTTEIFLQGQE